MTPDENAPGVTTWADGYGVWHATADNRRQAHRAIREELTQRGVDPNYRLRITNEGGRHWMERP